MRDSFRREIFAKKIIDEISNKYNDELKKFENNQDYRRENIVFAISGKWGEGKTFLLNEIEVIAKKKGFRIVSFDPWKYTQDEISIKRAFLKELNKQLNANCNLDNLYSESSKTVVDKKEILKWVFIFYFVYILFLIFSPLINYLLPNFTVFIQYILPLGLISLFVGTFSINRKSAIISTSDEFEDKFKEIIEDKTKILCLIDNLDRCEPTAVKKILDSLKTFMCHKECSYIITGDHTVIERYVGERLHVKKEEETEEGRRFIKKLFDVYWRLPLPTAKQFKKFIEDTLNDSEIELKDTPKNNVLNMLNDDDLFERNPRHTIRFITKLRFTLETIKIQFEQAEDGIDDLEKKDLEDVLNNPDLLAKVLLIEEFFYDFYSFFVIHPDRYVLLEKAIKSGETKDNMSKYLNPKLSKVFDDDDKYGEFIKFVNWQPQFTDGNKNVIHEVNAFFTFSGATGLPSSRGPDESRFIEFLKNGQLIGEFREMIENGTGKEKNRIYAKNAIETFDKVADQEKLNAIDQSLELCNVSSEWLGQINAWSDRYFTHYPDNKDLYQKLIKAIIKNNNSALIKDTYLKNKEFFNESFWNNFDSKSVTEEIKSALVEISNLAYGSDPQDVVFLEKYFEFDKEYKTRLNQVIKDREDCKKIIIGCKNANLLNTNLCTYVYNKLILFLNNVDCVDWVVKNKTLFDDKQDLLKRVVIQMLDKANTENDFIRLLSVKDVLNQDKIYDVLIKKIANNIQLIEKSEICSKLNKEDKLLTLDNLTNNFFQGKIVDYQDKVILMMTKDSDFLKDSGINTEDISPFIKKVSRAPKKLKITNINTRGLRKKMRESWGL